MKVELKSIKVHKDMSEETTCFSADIFVDGRKAGYCKNNGRGGCTDYHSYPGFHSVLLKAQEQFCSMPDIVYPKDECMGEFTLKCTFENWIDLQIANEEGKRFKQKLNKHMLKGICFGNEASYSFISWTNYTIDQLLNSPVGKATIQKKVDELKAKGETILNTNLVGIILD